MSARTQHIQHFRRRRRSLLAPLAGSALISASILGFAGQAALADTVTCSDIVTAWTSTSGVYLVSTIDQLYCLGAADDPALLSESFLQTADLTWSARTVDVSPDTDGVQLPTDWSIIGNGNSQFTGRYNGGNHVLSSVPFLTDFINDVGIFGYAYGATIENLSVTGVQMSGNENIGGLAGVIDGPNPGSTGSGTALTNVSVSGTVTSRQQTGVFVDGGGAGGLVGRVKSRFNTITDSQFNGSVSSVGGNAGGLVGAAEGLNVNHSQVGSTSATTVAIIPGTTDIENNPNNLNNPGFYEQKHSFAGGMIGNLQYDSQVNNSTFDGTVSGKNYIGGLVGYIYGGANITASTANGVVQGRTFVGGLVGYLQQSAVSDSHSSATVSANSSYADANKYVGGIVGAADYGASLSRLINSGNVSGATNVGGIAGALAIPLSDMDSAGGNGTISQSYSTGTIVGSMSGGIAGLISDAGQVTQSFALSTASAYSIGSNIARNVNPLKTSAELKASATYSAWDPSIVQGWDRLDQRVGLCAEFNTGYPYLLALQTSQPIGCVIPSVLVPTIQATAGDQSVSITLGNIDSGATNYQYSLNDGVSWTSSSPVTTTGPISMTGLTNGTSYSVRVRAVNAVGYGASSEAVSFTPTAVTPDAPTSLVATPGDGQVSIAFVAGANGGSVITGYEYSLDEGAWAAASPSVTASPLVISGLTNGTSYSVRVRAVNVIGGGAASEAVVVTPTQPPATSPPSTVPATTVPSTTSSSTTSTVPSSTPTTVPAPAESVILDLPAPSTPLLTDTTLEVGQPVFLEFGGFVPGEFVQLIVASTPRVIGSGYANSLGFVRLSGDLPANLVAGKHSLALYAPESGRGVRQPIVVEAPVRAKNLPATGGTRGVTLPIFFVMLGLTILLLSRFRIFGKRVAKF